MSVSAEGGAAPPSVLDDESYADVVIVKTDEVEGFVYRRGTRHKVDGSTFATLKTNGMLPADAVAPGADTKAVG